MQFPKSPNTSCVLFWAVLKFFQQMCSHTERWMIFESFNVHWIPAWWYKHNILLIYISVFLLQLNKSCALGNEASERKFCLVIKTPCFSCLIIPLFLLFHHQVNSMLMECILKGAPPKETFFRAIMTQNRTGLVDYISAKRSEKLGFSSMSSIVICPDHYK